MENDNYVSELSITIQNREIRAIRKMMKVSELRFYPDNPRIYSLLRRDDDNVPEQIDIYKRLQKMDHVKVLHQSIMQNGGITDPLLVRNSDKAVLEGNSRLSVYRKLCEFDPVKWGKVKCDVIIGEIDDDDLIALLANYHVIGRKEWSPYEQAGLFWRWKQNGRQDDEISNHAHAIGLSGKRVKHMIDVYEFMIVNKESDHPDKWSYYDEYLKSRYIQKQRAGRQKMDSVIVSKVRRGEIEKAVDIREKVATISKAGGKTIEAFLTQDNSLDKCYDASLRRGFKDPLLQRLKKVREDIAAPDFVTTILDCPASAQKKYVYELEKIGRLIPVALKKMQK